MRVQRTPAEAEQIKRLLQTHNSFHKAFRSDWTNNVLSDLKNRLYGKIPRNFVLNISGLIGTPTGIFKSAMGLQIALAIDPHFSLRNRVAFSVNELLDKIRNNSEMKLCNFCYHKFQKSYPGTYETNEYYSHNKCDNCENMANRNVLFTKLVYFLDEQTKTLKMGGLTRLMNIVDTARQRQICFITCGVEGYDLSFTTYNLLRIQESSDEYLPKKIVRYGVYDDKRDIYYGYFKWNVTPLTDSYWKSVWDEYSKMKTNFQRIAMSSQTQTLNLEEYAQEIINSDDFMKCFKTTKDGRNIFQTSLAKTLIYQKFSDMTNQEREMILSEIKMAIYSEDDG